MFPGNAFFALLPEKPRDSKTFETVVFVSVKKNGHYVVIADCNHNRLLKGKILESGMAVPIAFSDLKMKAVL